MCTAASTLSNTYSYALITKLQSLPRSCLSHWDSAHGARNGHAAGSKVTTANTRPVCGGGAEFGVGVEGSSRARARARDGDRIKIRVRVRVKRHGVPHAYAWGGTVYET